MRVPAIVSAADARYGRCLMQLLASIVRHHEPGAVRCIAYDLGLRDSQRTRLTARFPCVELRTFPFARYPDFVRLRDRPLNTNAWKPQLIKDVLDETNGVVLWLDSATVVLAPLHPVIAWTERTGLYTPFGGRATIAELTHGVTLEALGAVASTAALRQRASGVVSFDARHPRVRALVEAWADACLSEPVIIPPGATLRNHRFDQSVLNVLLAQATDVELTEDELDISSERPTRFFRTRNKLPPWLPLWMDPLARSWFAAYRAVDVMLWRLKSRLLQRGPSRLRSTSARLPVARSAKAAGRLARQALKACTTTIGFRRRESSPPSAAGARETGTAIGKSR